MIKDQQGPKLAKHQSQKSSSKKQIKSQSGSIVMDNKLFTVSEKDSKILIDQRELNNILLNIEKSKYGEYYTQEVSKITLHDMKKRILIINPDFPVSELSHLFLGKTEITSKELFDILQDNDITDIDPMNETIKLICNDKDILDMTKVVNSMMQVLGYGKLHNQDLNLLQEILDIDQDRVVSKQDLKDSFIKKSQ